MDSLPQGWYQVHQPPDGQDVGCHTPRFVGHFQMVQGTTRSIPAPPVFQHLGTALGMQETPGGSSLEIIGHYVCTYTIFLSLAPERKAALLDALRRFRAMSIHKLKVR